MISSHIEIDRTTGNVRVNGTDVGLIAEDGIDVAPETPSSMLTVTLKLFAARVDVIGPDRTETLTSDYLEPGERDATT